MYDLRTTRKNLGLTASQLASGMLREATVLDIELGKVLPRQATRRRIETALGEPVDWIKTLAGPDRQHLMFALREFINVEEPGVQERVSFSRKALLMLSESI